MRRTARALPVAVLATAAFAATAGPAALAAAAAQVSPGGVQPGGTITGSVSCDAVIGTAPETIGTSSQAFEEGTVRLRRVTGTDVRAAAPVHRDTARVASAGAPRTTPEAAGSDAAPTADGTCPAATGGRGEPWSATFAPPGGDEERPCGETQGCEGGEDESGRDCAGSQTCDGAQEQGTGEQGTQQEGGQQGTGEQ